MKGLNNLMHKVLVIGGAGYVGKFLIEKLIVKGYDVYAITRENGLFLLENYNVKVLLADNIKSMNIKFDVIINLAYAVGRTFEAKKKNLEIIKLISEASHEKSMIIHTSSLAVFGFTLDREIKAEKLDNRSDFVYVESKIHFENELLNTLKKQIVHIVRLGNVWGPASKNWTVPLINNIIFEKPVGIMGEDGYSNVTDVRNAASYLCYLINYEPSSRCNFHHLAEFSNLKWSYWISQISNMFNSQPVLIDMKLKMANSLIDDLRYSMQNVSPLKMGKYLMGGRKSGSYLRNLFSVLPASILNKIDVKVNKSDFGLTSKTVEPVFFAIMTCKKEFKSNIIPDWMPDVSKEQAVENVYKWAKEAGYLLA